MVMVMIIPAHKSVRIDWPHGHDHHKQGVYLRLLGFWKGDFLLLSAFQRVHVTTPQVQFIVQNSHFQKVLRLAVVQSESRPPVEITK